MIRKIIEIDEAKCTGCGLCAAACRNMAIGMQDGKARLLHAQLCDGLGVCLPSCKTGAIRCLQRETVPFDFVGVHNTRASRQELRQLADEGWLAAGAVKKSTPPQKAEPQNDMQLKNWPVKIKLMPITASFYDDADILVASDCVGTAYPQYYNQLVQGRVVMIGCSRIDMTDYTQKLGDILRGNRVRSVTLARMDTDCCNRIMHAVETAVACAGRPVPLTIHTIGLNGSCNSQF